MNRIIKLICLFIFSSVSSVSAQYIDVYYYVNGELGESTIRGVNLTEWKKYDNPVFKDVDEGSVWFKFVVKDRVSKEFVIETPSIYVSSSTLYLPNGKVTKRSYDNFRFSIKDIHEPIYFKVANNKRSHIPVDIYTLEEFQEKEIKSTLIYTCYYSFVIAIFFITLLSYFQYRDKTYLIYIVLMIVVNINRSLAEGSFSDLVPNSFIDIDILFDQITHFFVVYVGFKFTVSYLEMEISRQNKFRTVVFACLTVAGLLLAVFTITKVSWYAFFSDIFIIIALSSILYSAYLDFNKSTYAKFYCIAFTPLMISAIDVYFLEPLGIKLIPMDHIEYRAGIAFEMIVLTLAIAYKGRILIGQNEEMKLSIMTMTKKLEDKILADHKKKDWKEVVKSDYGLTKQEVVVLSEILDQKKNKEIADKLFVSLNTIKFHTKNIYRKLNTSSKKEVIEKVKPLTLE